jgi:hypothetical protein
MFVHIDEFKCDNTEFDSLKNTEYTKPVNINIFNKIPMHRKSKICDVPFQKIIKKPKLL